MNILKNQSGMTLVEVLVSLVLLAVVIIAFSSAFVSGMRSEVWVNRRLEAARLAESIAEFLENNNSFLTDYEDSPLEYSYQDNFSGIDSSNLLLELIDEFDEKITSFDGVKIKNLGTITGLSNLYEIKINLTWQDSSYELVTRIHVDEEE